MRCLTLAGALRSRGAKIFFICRDHPDQMTKMIQEQGYKYTLLPLSKDNYVPVNDEPPHSSWLGVSWQKDAEETIQAFGQEMFDLLVIDHYGIGRKWHKQLHPYAGKILIIDDLADRNVDCDYLLDQTYGREKEDYTSLVPEHCQFFLGSKNALLRPEFARLRSRAIEKRKHNRHINDILVSMGGMDPDNITGRVLSALESVSWDISPKINVVLGGEAPNFTSVTEQVNNSSLLVNVLTNVENMADLMLEADLAVGAGGTTSWERCCLGLPSLVIVLAKNQKKISDSLGTAGAAIVFNDPFSQDLDKKINQAITMLLASPAKLEEMSHASASLTEGSGASNVADILMDEFQT